MGEERRAFEALKYAVFDLYLDGRGQTEAHKQHLARTARRATGNGAVAGNSTYLAFDLMELKEVVRCSREGVRSVAQDGALNQTIHEKCVVGDLRCKARSRKRLSGGAARERTYLMGPPTEARRRGTYHHQVNRLTVPHSLSFTTSANRGLLSRRVTTCRF